jgi:peptidoglycan/xylan/chitin deacetylase (PgdA/CDA1 family)
MAVLFALTATLVAANFVLFRHEVVRGYGRGGSLVALTFDDGPDPVFTPAVLDILAAHGGRATFFVIGEHVEQHPDIVKRIIAEGHEVAHHTHRHPRVDELDPRELTAEFDEALAALVEFDVEPIWYRPPRKALTFAQKRLARERGMRVALWTRSVERSCFCSAEQAARVITAETRPGDILLAHDGRLDRSMTVEALPAILEGLAARGLTCVTLSEMHGIQ